MNADGHGNVMKIDAAWKFKYRWPDGHLQKVWLCPWTPDDTEAKRLRKECIAAGGPKEWRRKYEVVVATVGYLKDSFLAAIANKVKPNTVRVRRWALEALCEEFGALSFHGLDLLAVQDWIDCHDKWSESAMCTVARVLRTWSRWSSLRVQPKQDPLLGLKAGADTARGVEVLIDDEHTNAILAVSPPWFARVVRALRVTGARPGEVMGLTADEVRLRQKVWEKKHHKQKHTDQPRLINLGPEMMELTRELLAEHPTGLLFPGPRGGRITSANLRGKLKEMGHKAKLPKAVMDAMCPYGWRHTFACKLLEEGKPAALVAKLMGHKSTATLFKNYGHILNALPDGDTTMGGVEAGFRQATGAEATGPARFAEVADFMSGRAMAE